LELRIRPFTEYPNLITLIGIPQMDASFPSSHVASTVAILSVYTYFYRKVWPFALLFVLVMGFARIHNGLHYPTDVLAGIILGIAYGLTAIYLSKKIVKLAK
jgi:undecaprenyl-diphosphatase